MSIDEFLTETEDSQSKAKSGSLRAVGLALDSRWMMGVAVLSVLAAIGWAMQSKKLRTERAKSTVVTRGVPSVQLLGVPAGSTITVDGRLIENTRFAISIEARHAVEVQAPDGRSWRQVLQTDGPLTLLVDFDQVVAAMPAPSATPTANGGTTAEPTTSDGGEAKTGKASREVMDPWRSDSKRAEPSSGVRKTRSKNEKPRRQRPRATQNKPAKPATPAAPAAPAAEEDDSSLILDPGF